MAFKDANVDNRLRHFVRGRVIVATTSAVVEFLEEGLKYSYPLYSFNVPAGEVAVFMVELNGFLTFDSDSYVKVSNELNSFERAHFDPTGFAYVTPADGSIIQSLSYNYAAGNTAATFAKVFILTPTGENVEKDVWPLQFPATSEDFGKLLSHSFPVGSTFRLGALFSLAQPGGIE